MSVDCDGQKPPTPIPLTIATRNPCHGSVDERVARVADGEDRQREREHPLAAEAIDLRAEDRAGHDAHECVRSDDEPGETESRYPARCGGR